MAGFSQVVVVMPVKLEPTLSSVSTTEQSMVYIAQGLRNCPEWNVQSKLWIKLVRVPVQDELQAVDSLVPWERCEISRHPFHSQEQYICAHFCSVLHS